MILASRTLLRESKPSNKKCPVTGMSEVITTTKVYWRNMIFNCFCVKRPVWLLVKLVYLCSVRCLQIRTDCCRVTVSDGNSCTVHLITSSVLLNSDSNVSF